MKRIILPFLCLSSVAMAIDVTEVKVKTLDGFGGDSGSVVSRCQTKAGAKYDETIVTRDVTQLKSSGEFEEIAADAVKNAHGGVDVVFYVKRKVRYNAPLVLEGNEFFSESKIAKEAGLQDGSLYGESDLAEAAARIRLAYRKKNFADAKVVPRVEIISGNNAKISFLIDEGQRRKIRNFVFSGATYAEKRGISYAMMPFREEKEGAFDEKELRDAIGDHPWWNPIGWFSDSPSSKDALAQCCDKIAEVFRNHGFLDVVVTGPEEVEVGDDEKDIVFNIQEGPLYKIGNMSIQGLKQYPEQAVRDRSELPETGAIAGGKVLDEAAHRIKVTVGSGDRGLADTRVDVLCIPAASPGVVDVVFKVTEGVPVRINEVKIRGNDFTKDRVIRREIRLSPGDRMLEDQADRSKKRLENLGYFARVGYNLEKTNLGKDENGAEYRDLVYEVEEKNTGAFMVGIGASSVDSVYLSAEVSQNNFDLFAPSKLFRGGGQKARAYVAWGPRYQSAEIGLVEPYFLDRMLELSVDAYRRMRWYDEYDLYRSGASASISYPVKFMPHWEPFGRFGVGFSGEFIEFDDVEKGAYYDHSGKEVSFEEEKRRYDEAIEPVLHIFWARDTRDNFRMPTTGYRTKIFADIAPGGDNEYWRFGFNHRNYFTVSKRYGHVFMLGLRAETIDAISGEVPIYNRMFLGGPKSIRGIEYRNVAPLVSRDADGRGDVAPWGGQTLFCLNAEYTIPIVKMLRFAVFSDVGGVGVDDFDFDFSDTFAWTVGVGLRIDLPMFPIRLDVATPIEEPDMAEKEAFSFTVGYDF